MAQVLIRPKIAVVLLCSEFVCSPSSDGDSEGNTWPLGAENSGPEQVPPKAAQQKRGYSIRMLILSRNLVRANDFLGQADVPLSLLQVP